MNLFEIITLSGVERAQVVIPRVQNRINETFEYNFNFSEQTNRVNEINSQVEKFNQMIKQRNFFQKSPSGQKINVLRLRAFQKNLQTRKSFTTSLSKKVEMFVDRETFFHDDSKLRILDLDLNSEFVDFLMKYLEVIYLREILILSVLYPVRKLLMMDDFMKRLDVFKRYSRILSINYSLPISREQFVSLWLQPYRLLEDIVDFPNDTREAIADMVLWMQN